MSLGHATETGGALSLLCGGRCRQHAVHCLYGCCTTSSRGHCRQPSRLLYLRTPFLADVTRDKARHVGPRLYGVIGAIQRLSVVRLSGLLRTDRQAVVFIAVRQRAHAHRDWCLNTCRTPTRAIPEARSIATFGPRTSDLGPRWSAWVMLCPIDVICCT